MVSSAAFPQFGRGLLADGSVEESRQARESERPAARRLTLRRRSNQHEEQDYRSVRYAALPSRPCQSRRAVPSASTA